MFNKETEYALRGLVYIKAQNNRGRRPGIEEIAKEIEAPRFYTAKILQRLAKAGFVESLKGKGGGFYFAPEKPDLRLEILVTSIEGNGSFSGCGFGLKQCRDENPCPLHGKYSLIRKRIKKLVSEETVQSLARKAGRKDHLGKKPQK